MAPSTDTVWAWPLWPLASGAPSPQRVDAARAIPGASLPIPLSRAPRSGLTISEQVRQAERQSRGGFHVRGYVPTGEDLGRLERLHPGCAVDAVPWEAIRAELDCAPPGLIERRQRGEATAPALLRYCEALRHRLAEDEAASRGVGEPEAPRATPARTSPKRKATEPSEARILAGQLLIEAWNQSDSGTKPFPGYPELIRTAKQRHGVDISKSNLTNAQRDLGELAEPIRRWVNPRRLSPSPPDDPKATPGEVEDCRTWFMLRPEYQRAAVFEQFNALTPEALQVLAAQPVEHWEDCLKSMVKESGAGIR